MGGTSAMSSFCSLLAKPGNVVEPPDNTMLEKRSLHTSGSHFMMELLSDGHLQNSTVGGWD